MTIHQDTNDVADAAHSYGRASNALAVAERSFLLLISGPSPLAVGGRELGHGLPARPVDLSELRTILLDRSASDGLKDAVWGELVRRARTGDPAWVIGCVGVAMPGLKSIAARVIRSSPQQHADDIVSELLTEFVAQLTRIDIDRPYIAARLILWARKGAFRARGRAVRHVPRDPRELPASPVDHGCDPVELLLEAVRHQIITPAAADVIIATRLDGISMQAVARGQGVPAGRLYRHRRLAEMRIVTAIREGDISAPANGDL